MIDVAIVGAGPAGSNCAYTLARHGIQPVIFDPSHPREKPCGGIVSAVVKEAFPALHALPFEHSEIWSMRILSPSGRTLTAQFRKTGLLGVSRAKFDHFLLDKALKQGALLMDEKVTGVKRINTGWIIQTSKQSYETKTLVGADGVCSLVRRSIIGPLNRTDVGFCFGYYVHGLKETEINIKFLPDSKGYLWVVPHGKQASVGGGTAEPRYFNRIKKEVQTYIKNNYPNAEKGPAWTALIPNIKKVSSFRKPIAGSNWALIGDAAGHVDSISGSGIIYALLGGELAAESIADGCPESFNKRWVEAYGQALFLDTKLRRLVYRRFFTELYCLFMKLRVMTNLNSVG